MSTGRTKIRKSGSDKVFDGIVLVFLTLLLILVLYPLIYIVSASFSSASAVTSGKVILLPVDFSWRAIKRFLKIRISGWDIRTLLFIPYAVLLLTWR